VDEQKRTGLFRQGINFRSLVAGFLHVDDVLLVSKALCCSCLFEGLKKTVPHDVGLSCEATSETNQCFAFLHLWLDFSHSPGNLRITPHLQNWEFAKGRSLHPKVARCQLWLSSNIQGAPELRPYLLSKLFALDYVFEGSFTGDDVAECLAVVLAEILLLRWPVVVVSKVLRSFDCRRASGFMHLASFLGRYVKSCNFLQYDTFDVSNQHAWGPVYEMLFVAVRACQSELKNAGLGSSIG
jgi:hypothetical protein